MSSKENGDSLAAISLLLLLFFAYLVWEFKKFFGLDIPTSLKVIFGIVIFSVLLGASLYCSNSYSWDLFGINNTWPLLLIIFYISWWPAFNFWAAKTVSPFFHPEAASVWWDGPFIRSALILAFLGGGYGKKFAQFRSAY